MNDKTKTNAQRILDEVRAEHNKHWESYDRCKNCGLEGEGGSNPWTHTYRFEMDETICKRCGASYETSSEKYKAPMSHEKVYDHHEEHANREVHAIQAKEAS